MVNKVDDTVVDFFSVLLKDTKTSQKLSFAEPEEKEIKQQKDQELQALLSTIPTETKTVVDEATDKAEVSFATEEVIVEKVEIKPETKPLLADILDEEFQVLYFSVAGLVLAVPLVNLGGIINSANCTNILGRPTWFNGVQMNREQNVNVVDTAAWVMPEKYTDELKASISYQYVVLLEGSDWGLACESLMSADTIDKSKVNWRQKTGKRPWLAGVVKDKMCGILNVDALIQMLDKGLNCQDSIN
ncbi:chemotaxis protein CheW [Shewanella sp. OPT22]|nr:chemotaxis protein CheW [Shewanella sp. OPT22]